MSDSKNMSLGVKLAIFGILFTLIPIGISIYCLIYFNSQKYKNTVLKNYYHRKSNYCF